MQRNLGKSIVSFALSAFVALGQCPAVALAEGTGEQSTLGQSGDELPTDDLTPTEGSATDEESVTEPEDATTPEAETQKQRHDHGGTIFDHWIDDASLPTEAGDYYLTEDVALSSTWTVPEGETTICLNNKSILVNKEKTASFDAIVVPDGSSLTLVECQRSGAIRNASQSASGHAVVVEDGGSFAMRGGAIIGFKSTAVVVDGGTFDLSGGEISGNSAPAGMLGGGVFVSADATLNVKGAPRVVANRAGDAISNVYLQTASKQASEAEKNPEGDPAASEQATEEKPTSEQTTEEKPTDEKGTDAEGDAGEEEAQPQETGDDDTDAPAVDGDENPSSGEEQDDSDADDDASDEAEDSTPQTNGGAVSAQSDSVQAEEQTEDTSKKQAKESGAETSPANEDGEDTSATDAGEAKEGAPEPATLNVVGRLDGGAQVGISRPVAKGEDNDAPFTKGYKEHGNPADPDTYFFSDDASLAVAFTEKGDEARFVRGFKILIASTISNGKVAVSNDVVAPGRPVFITATPEEGYELDRLAVVGKDDKEISIEGSTFIMPASDVTVSAAFKETPKLSSNTGANTNTGSGSVPLRTRYNSTSSGGTAGTSQSRLAPTGDRSTMREAAALATMGAAVALAGAGSARRRARKA